MRTRGDGMKRMLLLFLVVLGLLGAFSAYAEPVDVLVSFYPLHIFTQNLLKDVDGVRLSSLAPPSTGCLHDYQLLSSDMLKLSKSNVFIINGAGMEPYLHMVVRQMPQLSMIDASKGITLLPAVVSANQGKNNEKADKLTRRGTRHELSDVNSHIWLSPKNAMKMSENIAEGLMQLLPEKAEKIKENLSTYLQRLAVLDKEMREGLKNIANRKLVTFHEAFPYFTRDYGLETVAVLAVEPDKPLSPRFIKEISEFIRQAGSPPLFTEEQYTQNAVKVIAAETGARVYVLDPVVLGEYEEDAYEKAMRKNLVVLQEALSGE